MFYGFPIIFNSAFLNFSKALAAQEELSTVLNGPDPSQSLSIYSQPNLTRFLPNYFPSSSIRYPSNFPYPFHFFHATQLCTFLTYHSFSKVLFNKKIFLFKYFPTFVSTILWISFDTNTRCTTYSPSYQKINQFSTIRRHYFFNFSSIFPSRIPNRILRFIQNRIDVNLF